MYGTSQRALARCACAQRTGFLIKFFNQESVLQGNGRKKAQPQGRAAETVTMFENPPPLDISSHLKIFPCKKKKRTSEDVRFMLALPIFPGRLQPSIVGRSELNFRVRDGNGWTLALISTNYIATTFAVTTIIFTFPLSVKRKMVTRTGFEPMLKA